MENTKRKIGSNSNSVAFKKKKLNNKQPEDIKEKEDPFVSEESEEEEHVKKFSFHYFVKKERKFLKFTFFGIDPREW